MKGIKNINNGKKMDLSFVFLNKGSMSTYMSSYISYCVTCLSACSPDVWTGLNFDTDKKTEILDGLFFIM